MSVLGLSDLLRRKEVSSTEHSALDQEVSFEHEMAAALELNVEEDSVPQYASTASHRRESEASYIGHAPALDEPTPPTDVLTPHAQSLLATFSVFEEANNATREELAIIGKAFTSIVTNYNLGREFIDSSRQQIIRGSELEQANHRLTTENRRLQERVEKQENMRERLDDMLEGSKRREAKLVQEADTLRVNLSDLRLELIESRNANVSSEHARTEMHMNLATKNADLERLTREIEVLREKLTGVSSELDSSQKRQSEMRNKLEEMHAMYTSEVNRYAELNGRASAADKEILRLQKQCDAAEAQIKESSLAVQTTEHELWERDRRHQSELQALRAETEQLTSRLQRFTKLDAKPEQAVQTRPEEIEAPLIPLKPRPRTTRPGEKDAPADAAE